MSTMFCLEPAFGRADGKFVQCHVCTVMPDKLDGSVEKTTDQTLQQNMDLADDVGSSHWLYPRQ